MEKGKEIIEVEAKAVTDRVYQPEKVMEDATAASKTLKKYVDGKVKPVKINGETYLEFEDWQTVGRYYGVTAKALDAELVEIDGVKGFKAKAVAMKDGVEIGGAVAYCLRDEKNWETKPLFQLASMAQTRASAKALRNVLAWVVVLAGYKTTPAEEMTDTTPFNNGNGAKPAEPRKFSTISKPQAKRFYAICNGGKIPKDIIDGYLNELGIENAEQMKPELYEDACNWAKEWAA